MKPKKRVVFQIKRLSLRSSRVLNDFNGRAYEPIAPQADDESIYDRARLMYRHNTGSEPNFFWAETGALTAGWVIGLETR